MYCHPWSTYVTIPYPRIAAKKIEKVNMTYIGNQVSDRMMYVCMYVCMVKLK